LWEQYQLTVNPAHSFQGDERDVILFSPCVGSPLPRGAKRFLENTDNLLNVAVTRARGLLHVVGDLEACRNCGIRYVEEFAEYVATLQNPRGHPQQDSESVSEWEIMFREALKRAGLNPHPQYPEHQHWLDLAIIDSNVKLNVEIDGELYHREWDGSRCREDLKRDRRLRGHGWVVKRFWVYRIRDEMDECVREVLELLKRLKG
jgi:very-short-patch-repair endonuclease